MKIQFFKIFFRFLPSHISVKNRLWTFPLQGVILPSVVCKTREEEVDRLQGPRDTSGESCLQKELFALWSRWACWTYHNSDVKKAYKAAKRWKTLSVGDITMINPKQEFRMMHFWDTIHSKTNPWLNAQFRSLSEGFGNFTKNNITQDRKGLHTYNFSKL